MRHSRFTPILWGAVSLITALTLAAPCSAGEDVDGFLRALYERNYFDVALDYIEQIKTNPRVDNDTKSAIGFLHARTEFYRGRSIPDSRLEEKEEQFRKSISSFQAFAEANPNHPYAIDSLLEVGGVQRSMAQTRLAAAEAGGDREQLLGEARKLLQQSQSTYKKVLATLNGKLEALRTNPPKVDDISVVREKLIAKMVGAEFQFAEVAQDTAATYKKGSAAYKKNLENAATRFEDFFDAHSDLIIGMQAIVRAGQCYRDMGNLDFALSCFESILDDAELATVEVLKPLRYETMGEAMVLWQEQVTKAKNYRQALPIFERAFRISELRGKMEDMKDPAELTVIYQRAELASVMAEKMRRIQIKQIQKRFHEIIEYATAAYAHVANSEGKYQGKAAAAYKKLTGEEAPTSTTSGPIEDFAAAIKQSRRVYADWTNTLAEFNEAEGAERATLAKKNAEQLQSTLDLLKKALDFADRDTSLSDLSDVYSRMAIAYWYQQKYPEAAVMGEHLARRYPEALSALTSADIAIKAWFKMFDVARKAGQDTSFEKAQIAALAIYISERWPESDQAADALYRLLVFSMEENDLEAGLSILEKMPPGTPYYASSQLILGRRLWQQHQRSRFEIQKLQGELQKAAKQKNDVKVAEVEGKIAAIESSLPDIVARVEPLLSDGLQSNLNTGSANPRLTFDALYLSELYVHTDQAGKAVQWLSHDQIGPLTLLDAGEPIIANQRGMPASVYRTSLQAYVKDLSNLEGAEFDAAKAKVGDLMNKLEANVSRPSIATNTYYSLGRMIETDIANRLENGDDAAAARLTDAFELILTQFTEKSGSATYPMLYWVARSLKAMGTTSEQVGDDAKAKVSFAKAAKAYGDLLNKKKKFDLKPESITALTIALAECQIGMGDFEAGIASITEAIKQQPNYISAQRIAARALQAAGKYREANVGQGTPARGSTTRLIWGWKTLAGRVDGKPKYIDVYYESKLGLIECLEARGKAGEAVAMRAAKQTMRNFEIQNKELGGKKWKPKFEAVKARLQ